MRRADACAGGHDSIEIGRAPDRATTGHLRGTGPSTPTAGFVPWPGGSSGSRVRPVSSSGRGSRACASVDAYWAGTYVSASDTTTHGSRPGWTMHAGGGGPRGPSKCGRQYSRPSGRTASEGSASCFPLSGFPVDARLGRLRSMTTGPRRISASRRTAALPPEPWLSPGSRSADRFSTTVEKAVDRAIFPARARFSSLEVLPL